MARPTHSVEHLLRRAGFGVAAGRARAIFALHLPVAVAALTDYDPAETDIDGKIGQSGLRPVTAAVSFRRTRSSTTRASAGCSGWCIRRRRLQEKMALFWHHHFATAYSKIAGRRRRDGSDADDGGEAVGGPGARARADRALPAERASATSATCSWKSPRIRRCSYWLDGHLNFKDKPQENFGRELMELFTFGVEHYVEQTCTPRRACSPGGTCARIGAAGTAAAFTRSTTTPRSTTRTPKDFSFPIYPNGSKRIEARSRRDRDAGRPRFDQRARHPS